MTEALKALESLRQCAMHCESVSTKDIAVWDKTVSDILKDHEKDKQFCISAQQHTLRLIDKTQKLANFMQRIVDEDLGKCSEMCAAALAEFRDKT